MRSVSNPSYTIMVVLLGLLCGTRLFAQDGKIKIKAHPPEAYVFVDGQAWGKPIVS